jgi:lipopolysaccharide export system protein LptA
MKKYNIIKLFTAFFAFAFIVQFQLPAQKDKSTNLVLEHAETLTFDKEKKADVQVLNGNVRFRHDDALMFCDSAYFYADNNSMDAFGHVRMEQGDTLFVFSDVLFYDGNTKIARLRKNVRMINNNVVLTTDSLNYNRAANMGYYFNGGEMRDSSNVLVSERGYYYPNNKFAEFKYNVVLTNDDLEITSDTLRYNTDTKIAYLVGPSNVNSEDGQIYTVSGTYNTDTQYSELFKRSQVTTKDGRFLTADTIYYDKSEGIGRVFSRAEMIDTTQKVILRGNIGKYNEILSSGFFTDSALVVEYSSASDSLFMHADSLFYEKDSTYNQLRAYNNVRFFKSDMQGKCDSLTYSSRDSIMTMYFEPILWSENNQITGDVVQAFIVDSVVDYVFVHENAMMVMQDEVDDFRFNQLIGRQIKGYIKDNELYKVDVDGNAQSIYHPREEDGTLVGINRTESSFMTVYLKDNELERIVLFPGATGKITPDENLQKEDVFFPNFAWHEELRPINKEDIFRKTVPPVKKKEERKRRRRTR